MKHSFKIELVLVLNILFFAQSLFGQNLFDLSFGQKGQTLVGFGNVNDVIKDMIILPDKKILAVGESYDGTNSNLALARFDSTGRLDPTFGEKGRIVLDGILGYSVKIRRQSDGKIIVGGSMYGTSTSSDFAVFRFLSNGTLDTTFLGKGVATIDFSSGLDEIYDLMLLSNGRILCAGVATQAGEAKMALAQLMPSGIRDSSFGNFGLFIIDLASGPEYITAITPFDDNHFIAVGGSNKNGSNLDFAVAKFNYSGKLDSTFGINGSRIMPIGSSSDLATKVMVLPNHDIIVAGNTQAPASYFFDIALLALNFRGDLLTSFGTNGKVVTSLPTTNESVRAMVSLDSQYFFIAAKSFTGFSNKDDFLLLRYKINGQLDTSFGTVGKIQTDFYGMDDEPTCAVLSSDGKLFLAGTAQHPIEHGNFALVCYDTRGQLIQSFGQLGKTSVDIGFASDDAYASALLQDGSLILSGRSYWGSGNNSLNALSKLMPNGQIDSTFGINGRAFIGFPSLNCYPLGLAVESGTNKIVQAGQAGVGLTRDFMIARFLSNGIPDSTFNGTGKALYPLSPNDDNAIAVHITSNNKIYAVGSASIDNYYAMAVVRTKSNGQLDSTFGNGGKVFIAPNNLWSVANNSVLLPNGNLLIGGETSFPNSSNNSILLAMVKPDGSLDMSFGQSGIVRFSIGAGRDVVRGLLQNSNGSIIVVGRTFNGSDDIFIMRLLENGKIDSTFGLNGIRILNIPNSYENVNAITFQQGQILVAGYTTINGINEQKRLLLARFTQNGQIDSSFNRTGVFIPFINITATFKYLTSEASGIAVQTDQKIVACGSYQQGTNSDMFAMRLIAPISNTTNVILAKTLAIIVSPNPFSETTTVHIETEYPLSNLTFELYNVIGKHLRTEKFTDNALLFERKDLPNGFYIFRILSDGKWIGSGKITVTH